MDLFGLQLDSLSVSTFVVLAIVLGVMSYPYFIRIREWHRAKNRDFTIRVENIDATQLMDKFKQAGSDPVEVELETIHLKRAKGPLTVKHGSKGSKFNWILEFRGNTLILTRTEGELDANWVVEALEDDYRRRYAVEDILYPITNLDNGRIAHSTVDDPQKFFAYLHLLHTLPPVRVHRVGSRRSKNLHKLLREPV